MFARYVTPALLALAACSGASSQGPQGRIEDTPAPKTEAVLAGPLCEGNACRCRQGDTDAGKPEGDAKRFEIKVGPSDDPLWVTVDGMVMFKNRDQTDACWYVDLPTGGHKVSLRGKAEGGLNIALEVGEQGGEDGSWWYRTFDFNCGAPGECDLDQVKAWKDEIAKLQGKHDPCGSTKIESIEWETGRMPDRAHPDDLLLRFNLHVYKFKPTHGSGSPECDKTGGAAPAADPAGGFGPESDPGTEPPGSP